MSTGLREELAEEAARLIAEHGIEDYSLAKRKAAERFGARFAGALPSNAQIHERLVERQRIFESDERHDRLVKLRTLASHALQLLEPFRPKLVGAVLDGTATASSAIEVHTFSDSPEDVAATLQSHGLRVRNHQRRYRFGRESTELIPGFTLALDGEELEVMVFPERGSNHAPLSPVDGRPMRRASRSAVLALLAPAS
jgi:hypothetical protein